MFSGKQSRRGKLNVNCSTCVAAVWIFPLPSQRHLNVLKRNFKAESKLFCFLCFLSWQSRRSSSRGKRRHAPGAPRSRAGRKAGNGTDRTPTPAVELRVMCRQRGSPRGPSRLGKPRSTCSSHTQGP